jgi:predicted lipid-binding transport protein (Tim44 family)
MPPDKGIWEELKSSFAGIKKSILSFGSKKPKERHSNPEAENSVQAEKKQKNFLLRNWKGGLLGGLGGAAAGALFLGVGAIPGAIIGYVGGAGAQEAMRKEQPAPAAPPAQSTGQPTNTQQQTGTQQQATTQQQGVPDTQLSTSQAGTPRVQAAMNRLNSSPANLSASQNLPAPKNAQRVQTAETKPESRFEGKTFKKPLPTPPGPKPQQQ